MGIIADSFQRRLNELRRIDEQSQQRTNKLLRDIDKLIESLKDLDKI
jgi:hypothetical protein